MRTVKLGVLGALIVVTCLALLWVTEVVPRADIKDIAPKALGAVVVLVIASVVWSAISGKTSKMDNTDKPVP